MPPNLEANEKLKSVKVIVNPERKYMVQLEQSFANTERWNIRPDEFKVWKSSYDGHWMIIGVDEETDQPVCCVSLARERLQNGDPLFSIGYFYCVPTWRGTGCGNLVFDTAMGYIGENDAYLFAVEKMSPWYAKRHGFDKILPFWHITVDILPKDIVLPDPCGKYQIKNCEEAGWDKVHAYDSTICCIERRKYLETTMAWPSTVSKAAVNHEGKVVGFGSIRIISQNELYPCLIYGESAEVAKDVLIGMLSAIDNLESYSMLSFLFPETNKEVLPIVEELTKGHFEYHPLYRNQYRKAIRPVPWEKVFANDEPSPKYFEIVKDWIAKTENWLVRPKEFHLWSEKLDSYWLYIGIDEETEEFVCSVALGLQHTLEGEPIYTFGFFYCVPNRRGCGYGKPLFKLAMDRVGQDNASLYAVDEMSPWYAKNHGFEKKQSFWHMWAKVRPQNIVLPELSGDYEIKEIEESHWPGIHSYDREISQIERKSYMEASLTVEDTITRVAIDRTRKIVGFASIRFVSGNQIHASPVYADDEKIALDLLTVLLSQVPNLASYSNFGVLYPETNHSVQRVLEKLSLNRQEVHPIYRNQYRTQILPVLWDKVYGNDKTTHSIT
ncbi:unnamed protein product [Caenorhabditis auriculariae]|uniref:YitH/HolE acetyltransferase (GNAT) domain-containing protein n=1 Tax=Caenorhabditis auriculariae TaxID=2777116 RepID=A0A8S1HQ75_9PELO|nr:unnamed protein product [Caenorhabditis auriculariae]